MKKIIIIATLILSVTMVDAQHKSYKYADRDTCELWLDHYTPAQGVVDKKSTVVYVFGGGFVAGSRDGEGNVGFYNSLTQKGYNVIAIDYRLGMKGVSKVGIANPKPPFVAVRMATEDLVSATKWIIDNREMLDVDTSRMVMVGSSAGAITVLQMDYQLANQTELVSQLPADFRYAGVVSMSGALFSTQGKPKYERGPAPTVPFHGTKDKVVVYNKIRLFKLGVFGTNQLVKLFEKEGYPYTAIRYVDCKHEVAEFPREYNVEQISYFIDQMVDRKFTNQMDITIKDRYVWQNYKLDLNLNDLYNGN